MSIILGSFFLSFAALTIFYLMNRSNRNRKYNYNLRLEEKRNELMQMINKQMNEDETVEECDTTKAK